MWNNAKMESLLDKLKDTEAKLSIKDYQLKQCCFIAKEYEKKLQALMGNDVFYEYMKECMHMLLAKDPEFLGFGCEDDDEDLDEIVEDLK